MIDDETDPERRQQLESLLGEIAVANARVAYAEYQSLIASDRWKQGQTRLGGKAEGNVHLLGIEGRDGDETPSDQSRGVDRGRGGSLLRSFSR